MFTKKIAKKVISLLLLFPILTSGQKVKQSTKVPNENGITFEKGLNWQQIVAKAKKENKSIFIDCYTTWCGPCKEMEKSVYPLQKVGDIFNEDFISVKLQMDTSQVDDDITKARYLDAHYIQSHYKIDGYPTFMFFTPDGKILNKVAGLKSPDDFISMAKEVKDPEKNYYSLIERFKKGKTNLAQTSWLARQALVIGDSITSNQIATDYLLRVDKDSLFTRSNIEFTSEFTKTSNDKGFQFFLKFADSIDRIMDDDMYAQDFVRRMIFSEIVLPEMDAAQKNASSEPDWNSLSDRIMQQYGDYYAGAVITASRSSWGSRKKDWPMYTKYLVLFQNNYGSKSNTGLFPSLILNNYAWAVFLNSSNTGELKSALRWSERAILMCPSPLWMDTYANILYKLKRKDEAILWEETAAKLLPDNKNIQSVLEKMKKGLPISQAN